MDAKLGHLLSPTTWRGAISILILTVLVVLISRVLWRPSFPNKAPKVWSQDDWPIFGSLRFYSDRRQMILNAQRTVKTGNFGFYIGKKQVVSISGSIDARKTFYESKDLNFSIGNRDLLSEQPPSLSAEYLTRMTSWFNKGLTTLIKTEAINSKMNFMIADTRHGFESLAARAATKEEWRVMNPFDDIYRLVYRLTMRMLGSFEIADDPKLLDQTLSMFSQFDKFKSPWNHVFPWLPTPDYLSKLYLVARIFWIFRSIIKQRERSGKRPADTVQFLLDGGSSMPAIVSFLLGSIFAGQTNSGVMLSWLLIHLSQSPEWKLKVQKEVDVAIAKHRTSPSQSSIDVLDSLTLTDWETEFPIIEFSFRESIRLGFTTTLFRKNTSDHDLPIGDSGEVIPKDAYAVLLADNVHLNPDIYQDPLTFDPSRYLDQRAEGKGAPHPFLGWGSGRHPCLGMRLAKLEAVVVSAYFVAMFEYELADRDGGQWKGLPHSVRRNLNHAMRPEDPIYIRYKLRAA